MLNVVIWSLVVWQYYRAWEDGTLSCHAPSDMDPSAFGGRALGVLPRMGGDESMAVASGCMGRDCAWAGLDC